MHTLLLVLLAQKAKNYKGRHRSRLATDVHLVAQITDATPELKRHKHSIDINLRVLALATIPPQLTCSERHGFKKRMSNAGRTYHVKTVQKNKSQALLRIMSR